MADIRTEAGRRMLMSGTATWGWGIGAATLAYAAAGNGKSKKRAKVGAYVFGGLAGLSLVSFVYYHGAYRG